MTGVPAEAVTRSSAVMAVGTAVSRLTGFVRDVVLIWAIGTGFLADTYNVANTVPNVIFILLAGGALNAVFVPQLVRAMKNDADGGTAFADRLITAIGSMLIVITALAVLAAPWVVSAYAWSFTHSGSHANYTVAVTFARYFLPQIFFYGLYVMLSQVLNARGKFGPMMFTPILNNFVVIGTGIAFLVMNHNADPTTSNVTANEIRVLGIGTTLGVVIQALGLLPSLRRTNYRFRPRLDLRGKGLGTSYRLATWTLLFVLVNQIAYLAVVQIATSAGDTAAAMGFDGRGFTPYTKAYLILLLPHGVITVSVVTALLPRMSRAVADGRIDDMRADLATGLRLTGAVLVPSAVAFGVLGPSMSVLMFGHGNTSIYNAEYMGFVLSAFALGLVPFTIHNQLLRGFYAFEDTRTPVTINVWIAATNIVLAIGCAEVLPARWVAVGLAVSYSVSYMVGVRISANRLARRIGPLDPSVRTTYDKLVIASVAAAVPALAIGELAYHRWGTGQKGSLVTVIGGGLAMVVTFLIVAIFMEIREVIRPIDKLLNRLGW
ncbi:MAG TPA: murein biosynthesis integral membrane protein MurJ [Sporichthyaceae bacterium]|jgi:putative peptidoglycan lipid II flippase|nr:murein biosynthesis integral membrane protein MurJ [Sporichthyaceae bacterium]